MLDVTTFLSKVEAGDPAATDQLPPLAYEELRQLAAARMAHEQPAQTLQATAILSAIQHGNQQASEEPLPLV